MRWRGDAEVDRLWDEFHRAVNMTSRELREWLLTEASDEGTFPPDPDLGLPEPGRSVVRVLTKRKTDLTDEDLAVMQEVTEQIERELSAGPDTSPEWRHALMSLGHDPLKD